MIKFLLEARFSFLQVVLASFVTQAMIYENYTGAVIALVLGAVISAVTITYTTK